VALVQPNSAAVRAGVKAGDIVTAINDDPVSNASELSRALDALPDKAVLTLQRRFNN
jgi:S1-C subfamily serine protease